MLQFKPSHDVLPSQTPNSDRPHTIYKPKTRGQSRDLRGDHGELTTRRRRGDHQDTTGKPSRGDHRFVRWVPSVKPFPAWSGRMQCWARPAPLPHFFPVSFVGLRAFSAAAPARFSIQALLPKWSHVLKAKGCQSREKIELAIGSTAPKAPHHGAADALHARPDPSTP